MVVLQQTLGISCPPAETFSSFKVYLDEMESLFVESMQDAAENQWHEIAERMQGATEREIGAEIEEWWDRQIRRFRTRLRREHEWDRTNRLKRAKRRETIRRIHAEDQLMAVLIELERVKGDLAAEKALADYLKELRRCRDCNGELRN